MENHDVRRPRLTNHILDDLAVAVESIEGEIAYLAEALEREEMPLTDRLREGFKNKHTSLVRARDWLNRYIEATRSQRSDNASDAKDATDTTIDNRLPAQNPGVDSQIGLNLQ